MVREFDRNMFVMLLAIMIGAVIITYFVADLQNKTRIETLEIEHAIEIEDIYSKTENFTDNFLQGSIMMGSAREVREVANYYFDLAAKIWYPQGQYEKVIDNCTAAMDRYLTSYQKFGESKPYFIAAKTYTDNPSYIGVLGYYVDFAGSGENITLLRYNACKYLMYAAENLSLGQIENATFLMENFSMLEELYEEELLEYDMQKDLIDLYVFFEEDRTKPTG